MAAAVGLVINKQGNLELHVHVVVGDIVRTAAGFSVGCVFFTDAVIGI